MFSLQAYFESSSQVTSQLPRYAYLNTKSSWQSNELTKTRPRTPDLETMSSMRMSTHLCVWVRIWAFGGMSSRFFLSIICLSLWKKCEAVSLPDTLKVGKGTLTTKQRFKVEERPKAISHDVFILPRIEASIRLRPPRKLRIAAVEHQIRQDGMYQAGSSSNPHTIDPLQSSLATFIRRCPHPASVIASLRSNKMLRKLDWKDPGRHSYVRWYSTQ